MKRFIAGSSGFILTIALISVLTATVRAENIGMKPFGKRNRSWELIGRSVQIGAEVEHFGYLTHINGLPDEMLYSDSDIRTEATAKFTFFSRTFLTSRYLHGETIVTADPGNISFYLQKTPRADFQNPGSFREGDLIARFSVAYHKIFHFEQNNKNREPDTTVAALKQLIANHFNLEGRDLKLGEIDLHGRLIISGHGLRNTDPFDYIGYFSAE